MSTAKGTSYKSYRKTQTTNPTVSRKGNEVFGQEDEERYRPNEYQGPGAYAKAGKKEAQIYHEVVEEAGQKKRELRGIFREQAEPEEPFEPVEEPVIYSFRRLEELVKLLCKG
jgi:hypothetical protein